MFFNHREYCGFTQKISILVLTMEFIVWVEHFILRPSYNTKEMIAKVIPMSNSTSMALFPFRALVLSIVSIRMELNGLT